MKKTVVAGLVVLFVLLMLVGCSGGNSGGVSQEEYDSLLRRYERLQKELDELKTSQGGNGTIPSQNTGRPSEYSLNEIAEDLGFTAITSSEAWVREHFSENIIDNVFDRNLEFYLDHLGWVLFIDEYWHVYIRSIDDDVSVVALHCNKGNEGFDQGNYYRFTFRGGDAIDLCFNGERIGLSETGINDLLYILDLVADAVPPNSSSYLDLSTVPRRIDVVVG